MGYSDYMKTLLRPVGIYDLESGVGASELNAEGALFDALYANLLETEREAIPQTATGAGLSAYEELFPYRPLAESTADRRAAILALLRIGADSFTPAAIRAALRGIGLEVSVTETANRTLEISFPGIYGEPEQYEALQTRIAAIVPCHLAVSYALRYLTWTELETFFSDWTALEATASDWSELETYHET